MRLVHYTGPLVIRVPYITLTVRFLQTTDTSRTGFAWKGNQFEVERR